MSSYDWTAWNHSPSMKSHSRYYQGNPMAGTTKISGHVEKHGDVYQWAVFRRGEPAIYGTAPNLAAAKRAADRAEATARLEAAQASLDAAEAAVKEARARRDAIARELRGARLEPRKRQIGASDKACHPAE